LELAHTQQDWLTEDISLSASAQLTHTVLQTYREERDRGRTLLALLKTVAVKNSAPDVKLTYRNRFGQTANGGGTSGDCGVVGVA